MPPAAERAVWDAATGKEAARVQAAETMDDVRTSLEEVKGLLTRCRAKGTRVEINTMLANVEVVESGFEDVEAAMTEGDYRDAWARAMVARRTVNRVKTTLRAIDARWGGCR